MSFNTQGIDEMKLQLRRLAEAPMLASEELKLCALEVQQMAKNMAPKDYGDLEDAIQFREYAARNTLGQWAKGVRDYEVYINNDHPVSDPEKIKHHVENVGKYAWIVHEHMGWASHPTDFMPNEKRSTGPNGEERGGKFLERAGEAMRDRIYSRLARVVFKYVEVLDIE